MKKNNKKRTIISTTIAATIASAGAVVATNNDHSNVEANLNSSKSLLSNLGTIYEVTEEKGANGTYYSIIADGIKYCFSEDGVNPYLYVDSFSDKATFQTRDIKTIQIKDEISFHPTTGSQEVKTLKVTKIGDKAFAKESWSDDQNGINLIIGNNIEEIGIDAFYKAEFKQIIFPNNGGKIKKIYNNAFKGASGLPERVILTKNVQSIGQNAFVNCTSSANTPAAIYYSYKIQNIDPTAFGGKTVAIQVNPTTFKQITNLEEHNGQQYQQIQIEDLSTNPDFSDLNKIKQYLINNINNYFDNSPINPKLVSDLQVNNINFDYSIENNGKNIYLTNVGLNYFYDEEGNIINQNDFKTFGNISFVEKPKPTTVVEEIEASQFKKGWENLKLTNDWINSQNWSQIILDNKDLFFTQGADLIDSIDKITITNKSINSSKNNTLDLSYEIKEGSWYNENGELGVGNKLVNVHIVNFLDTSKDETKLNIIVKAKSINLDQFTAKEAQNKINNQLIYYYKDVFFSGKTNLLDPSKIRVTGVDVSDNTIKYGVSLAPGSYIDKDGNPGTNPKQFYGSIVGFHPINQYEPTDIKNPIDAQTLWADKKTAIDAVNLIDSAFIVANKDKIFTGNNEIHEISQVSVNKKAEGNTIRLTITLSNNSWYDVDGQLGNGSKEFSTIINNFEDPNKLEPTKIKEEILAQSLGLDGLSAEQAKNTIDKNFIANNKDKFFTGFINITSAESIESVVTNVINNTISLTITLKPGSWANEQGELGNSNQPFSTTITGFTPVQENTETKVINPVSAIDLKLNTITANEAEQFLRESSFIFKNLKFFISGSHKITSPDQIKITNLTVNQDNTINLSFTLAANTWYDQGGQLGNQEKTFTTVVNNFKQEILNQPTEINKPIYANQIGLDQSTLDNALGQINSDLIFRYRDVIFKTAANLNSSNEITNVQTIKSGKVIKLSFTLVAGSYYDENGELGKTTKPFETTIEGFREDTQVIKKQTIINSPIDANSLGINNMVAQNALSLITPDYILQHKTTFFSGDYELSQASQIKVSDATVEANTIKFTLTLANGSWYGQDGQIGTGELSKQVVINYFLDQSKKKPTVIINPIQATSLGFNNNQSAQDVINQINNNKQFVVDHLANIFEGDYNININNIESVSASVSGNEISYSITLQAGAWYDQDGNIGNNNQVFTTKITGFKQPEQKTQTTVQNPLDAATIGLDRVSAQQAQGQFTSQFILKHLAQIIKGSHEIKNASQITNVSAIVNNQDNTINLSFTLAANTWYDQGGQLGNQEKTFTTVVNNFKQEILNQPTEINKPIYANQIGLDQSTLDDALGQINSDLIFRYKNVIFKTAANLNSSNEITNVQVTKSGKVIQLSFTLIAGSYYDENGELGKTPKLFETTIEGFREDPQVAKKQTIINSPIDANSLGINNMVAQNALSLITPDYILQHKTIFFSGDYELSQASQIKVSDATVEANTIKFTLTLANGSWYGQDGQIGTGELSKQVVINNFLDQSKKKPTVIINPIQATSLGFNNNQSAQDVINQINNNKQFVVDHLANIFEGDYNININNIESVSASVSGNEISYSITLQAGAWYDQDGNIGNNNQVFTTKITGFKQPEQKTQTTVQNPLDAATIGLDQVSAQQAQGQFTSQFILKHLAQIIKGSHEIKNASQITNVSAIVNNQDNTINLSFTLAANTWYDQGGQLGTNEKTFTTVVNNFKQEILNQPTEINKPIYANQIGLDQSTLDDALGQINSDLIFRYKNVIFKTAANLNSSNEITNVQVTKSGKVIQLSFTLIAGSYYDENGELGKTPKLFETTIEGFREDPQVAKKQTIINSPIDANSLGINNMVAQNALSLITPDYILQHKTIFFSGDYELSQASQIKVSDATVEANTIKFTLTLANGSWYGQDGQIGTGELSKQVVINNFLDQSKKKPTVIINPIQATSLGFNNNQSAQDVINQINNNKQFVVDHLANIFEGDYNININNIESVSASVSGNEISYSITLQAGAWYDQDGNIGNNNQVFTTKITGFKQPEQKTQTTVQNPLDAATIGLDQVSAQQAQGQFTSQFILKHLAQIIKGSHEIKNASQITNVSAIVNNQDNTINLSFTLAANTWYDQGGQLGTNEKTFTTVVINFKNPKTQTTIKQQIEASIFGLDQLSAQQAYDKQSITSQTVFDHINKILLGDHKVTDASQITNVNLVVNSQDNTITLSFKLVANTWYNQNGILGTNELSLSTTIINFKSFKPTDIKTEINAVDLGLSSYNAEQAIAQITKELIVRYKQNIFLNDYNIVDVNSIASINPELLDDSNEIRLTITLAQDAWYDVNNVLGQGTKQFTTIIKNFKAVELHDKTTTNSPLEANSIQLGSFTANEVIEQNKITKDLIFTYKDIIFNSHNIKSIDDIISFNPILSSNKKDIELTITLAQGAWYGDNKKPGKQEQSFNLTIINFAPKTQTTIKQQIEASIFGLDQLSAQQAYDKQSITSQTVFDHINKILLGDHKVTDASQITNVNLVVNSQDNTITLSFKLVANTWYNQNGILGTNELSLSTTIINFKSFKPTDIKTEINAVDLGLSSYNAEQAIAQITKELIVRYKQNIFLNDYNIVDVNSIASINPELLDDSNEIRLTITLAQDAWYDVNNVLGQGTKQFTTIIKNFKAVELQQPTTPKPNIKANEIELGNYTSIGAINQNKITKELIFKYKYVIFNSHNINSVDDIVSISFTLSSDKRDVELTITLKARSWYADNGRLGKQDQQFKTVITDFINKKPTQVVSLIEASEFGWAQIEANSAIDQINETFIYNNTDVFFKGGLNISNQNQIHIHQNKPIDGQKIVLEFTLDPQTWYDENGLGTSEFRCNVEIINFKQPEPMHNRTIINQNIEASQLNLQTLTALEAKEQNKINAKLVLDNIPIFFSGDYEIDSINDIYEVNVGEVNGNNLSVEIILNTDTWYDQNGKLSPARGSFTTTIINFKPEPVFTPTSIIPEIQAIQVGLENYSVQDAIDQITKTLIINYKDIIFTGDNKIENESNIVDIVINRVENKNELDVEIKLAPNTWYNQDGKLSKEEGIFRTKIKGFKIPHKPTSINNPINAQDLGLNNYFASQIINEKTIDSNLIFKYKNVFFSGENNIQSTKNIQDIKSSISQNDENSIDVKLTLTQGSWYDDLGVEGSTVLELSTTIYNFKEDVGNPTEIKERINASDFNLSSLTAIEAKDKFNSQFVYGYFDTFFTGNNKITSVNDIIEVTATNSNDELVVRITLRKNSYYDTNRKPGKENKVFTTTIYGFVPSKVKEPTKANLLVNAKDISLDQFTASQVIDDNKLTEDLIAEKINFFLSGSYEINSATDINDIITKKEGNEIKLTIILNPNTWYNADGQPGDAIEQFGPITISGFNKPSIPEPEPDKPNPNDQEKPGDTTSNNDKPKGPWSKWWTILLLCCAGAALPLLTVFAIIRTRKRKGK